MRGDVVDCRDQLGMLDPDVPDFAGGDRHVGRALDPLDHRDQVADLLLAAVDGFVADDDAVDVAVALGEFDHRADFALVALLVLVDPGADRDAAGQVASVRVRTPSVSRSTATVALRNLKLVGHCPGATR